MLIGSSLGYRNGIVFVDDISSHLQLPAPMASNALLNMSFSVWSLSFIPVSIQSLVCLVPILPVLVFTISLFHSLSVTLSRTLSCALSFSLLIFFTTLFVLSPLFSLPVSSPLHILGLHVLFPVLDKCSVHSETELVSTKYKSTHARQGQRHFFLNKRKNMNALIYDLLFCSYQVE